LGARLVFFGSKMEGNLGRKFRDEWHRVAGDTPLEDHSDDLIGKTTIPQLAATLKMCDLLISGDTGTMHLSAAVGTRVVGLFMGTASCHETGPYGEGHFVLQPLAPCFPCAEGNSPCREPACRTIIQPEVVYDLVRAILKEKDGTGLELPDCSDHIQIYRTSMDEWGVKFLPFVRREVDIGEIMAVAYREVGRKLMRPAYTIDLSGIAGELKGYYGGIAVNTLERLSLVLMNLSLLDSICKSGFGRGGHESFATVEEKIRRICGSLDVIMPLYGYFKELKSEEESNSGLGGKSAQLAARAISGTLRQLSAILQNTGLRL
ncbi:MAG: glycosyltransferase family 9 protein, partial [Thermodesulfobacteriota bacterium]|nr:glycosyltransferase family 9 protein [Thermodesulfobacteriota bacterium]